MTRLPRLASGWLERWGVIVVALVGWQLATASAQSVYFPEPVTVLERMHEVWFSAGADDLFVRSAFVEQLTATLGRLFVGWGTAIVIGTAIGVAIGLWRRIDDYVDPTLQFLRSLPLPALIPIFLILFGTGFQMRVSLVIFAVVWPIILNTIEGVRSVEQQKIETGVVFGVPRRAQILRIVVPAAAPSIFAGLRISLSLALLITVLAEMVASTTGLGAGLIDAQFALATVDLWSYIVVLAVLGVALNAALEAVERRVLAWHLGARRRGNET